MTNGLVKAGNCTFERFGDKELNYAKQAWQRAVAGAGYAAKGILQFKRKADAARILKWFGLAPASKPAHAQLLMGASTKMQELHKAITTRPITLVNRPDATVRHVPIGQDVYGYVWPHLAGSGFRIILGKWFLCDPDPYEAAQTIYHELTHKLCQTKDHAYGTEKCVSLASTAPQQAVNNADSFGYFMKSYLTNM